jgi:hypothetical protein
MRKAILATLTVFVIGSLSGCVSSGGGLDDFYVVGGVEEGDMLKMRAGPGTGYNVIVGIPNGTVLRVYSCEQTGSTRWCKATLQQPRGLTGYVSWAYLREK